MSIKQKFIEIRDNYVINQVKNVSIPKFEESKIVRCKVIFTGRVQNVGFRLEVIELSKRLGLTGFCSNLPDKTVLAQLQGPKNKIEFLLNFMNSLKRIKIYKMEKIFIPIIENETDFIKK